MHSPKTTTLGEEDNTKPVGVLIGKMAAKHLTRVLFLSALSSAISSSLSRSCSRQTFSSLVNTANSCGSHKAAFRGAQNKLSDMWFSLASVFHAHLMLLEPWWGLKEAHVKRTSDLSTGIKQTLPDTWDLEYEKRDVNNHVNHWHSFCRYTLVWVPIHGLITSHCYTMAQDRNAQESPQNTTSPLNTSRNRFGTLAEQRSKNSTFE